MDTTDGRAKWAVPARLAGMMFLQYFGLGAWIIPLTRYLPAPPEGGGLGFAPTQVGYVYMTLAIGGLLAPLVVGLLADRWFAVEKVIAATHLAMAVLLAAAGRWCQTHAGPNADPGAALGPLFVLMLGYAIGCQITLTLTNVISFRNLDDTAGKFGYVRLVGTFGWVVGGVVVGWVLNPLSADPLYLAAGASAVMAGFALTLPHTPPKGYGRPVAEVIGLPAVQLFRDRSFVVFAGVLVLGNMMNQFFSLFAPPFLQDIGVTLDLGPLGTWGPEVIMTVAQWVEMGCMAASPWLVWRFGLKRVMALGLAGWVLRNAVLFVGNVPLVVAVGLPMHGLSFALFAMLGSMFVDREAPPHLRAGAQALVVFLGSGPAVLAGNFLAGRVVEANRVGDITDWPAVWLVPLVGCAVGLAVFAALFREPPSREEENIGGREEAQKAQKQAG